MSDFSESFMKRQFMNYSVSMVNTNLVRIATLLLQRAPMELVIDQIKQLKSWPNIVAQDMLSATLLDVFRFPLAPSYVQYCAKLVISLIDAEGGEWSDSLLELLLGVGSRGCDRGSGLVPSDVNNRSYCGFIVDQRIANHTENDANTEIVYCTVDTSHNLVGFKTWGAGIFLSELCFNFPMLLADKTVLELGTGVGMTGIIASRTYPPPRCFAMTDFSPDVVDNIRNNIEMNQCALEECSPSEGHTLYTVMKCGKLDWMHVAASYMEAGSPQDNDLENILPVSCGNQVTDSSSSCWDDFDVLLAADCTYSEDIIGSVMKVIEVFLWQESPDAVGISDAEVNSGTDTSKFALLVSTIRSEETWQCLIDQMVESNLQCIDITTWAHGAANGKADDSEISRRIEFHCYFRERIRVICMLKKGSSLPSYMTPNQIDTCISSTNKI